MAQVTKVTISLPLDLAGTIEQRKKASGASRSEVIVELLAGALRREKELEEIERYIRGYLEQPETAEELAISDRLANEAAALDPWP